MAHKYPYTFIVKKGRLFQYIDNRQISRLHSFSHTQSKTQTNFPVVTYDNSVVSADSKGTIVAINIFNKKKVVIDSGILNIQAISFLNKNLLLSSNDNGDIQIHNLTTFHSKNIQSEPVLNFLKTGIDVNLESMSKTILEPLIADRSYEDAYELVKENPFLKETTAYDKLERIYTTAFYTALNALQKEETQKAKNSFNKFQNIKTKKGEIAALFQDFKHFERFKQHIVDKKYAIAYAICSKHPSLTLTKEYEEMESIYQDNFQLARTQVQLNQYESAKERLSSYLTVLSKRDEINNLLSSTHKIDKINTDKEKLLLLYKKNRFRECYELIDMSNIEGLELVDLLEKHWIKLVLQCEQYALNGNIKEIKKSLGELISIKTRADKIGDLLRVAFFSKIELLIEEKNFNSAQNIIYSYIDIFGEDVELKESMKKFERESNIKLAITQKEHHNKDRNWWLNSDFIVEY